MSDRKPLKHSPKAYCLILLVAGIATLFTACTSLPETNYEWLSLFFDGVPDPDEAHPVVDDIVAPSEIQSDETGTSVPVVELYVHEPYQKRNCRSCHETAFSNRLISGKEELCFNCHYTGGIRNAFTHAPVLSGDCWTCHNPHKSNNEHLLNLIGAELCFQCHYKASLIPVHEDYSSVWEDCISCHHPHGNNNKSYLLPDWPKGDF